LGPSPWSPVLAASAVKTVPVPGQLAAPFPVEVGTSDVLLRWVPEPGFRVGCHLLRAEPQDADGEELVQKCDGGRTEMLFTGLANFTRYRFSIAALNSHGRGPWSSSVEACTQPDLPGAPQLLSCEVDHSSLHIKWKPPTYQASGVLDYVLRASGLDPNQASEILVAAPPARVDGLLGNTTYRVSVAARNVAGVGDSAILEVTMPVRAPSAPRSFEMQQRLRWQPPADNGGAPVEKYILQAATETSAAGWRFGVHGLEAFTAFAVLRSAQRRLGLARAATKQRRGFEPKQEKVLEPEIVLEPEVEPQDSADPSDLRRLAEQGDAEAMYRYGKDLMQGTEKAEGAEWLLKSAQMGHRKAQSAVGEMYYTGLGLPQNKTLAFQWLKLAAEPPVAQAMFNLGVILQSGDGVPADKEKAFSYYTQAAQAGLTRAMNNLGYMLRVGDGVEEDKDAALQWYLKAAKAGDMDGQYHLGEMYHEGEGVKISKRRAGRWFLKAAEQGRKEAQYNVAMMYHFGNGLPADRPQAAEWYRKAAEQGLNSAQYALGVMCERGEGIEVDMEESFKWYKLAAEGGHIMAQNNLAAAYYLGEGVAEDKAVAATWFEKAAREGHAQAMKNLAKMYAAGDGVPEDPEKADYWFKKAGMGELYVKGKRARNF
ncbi:unnamed protein product, partial [Effrenium voratum]